MAIKWGNRAYENTPYKAGFANPRTFITGFSKQFMDAKSEAKYPLGVYVVPHEEYKRMVQDMGVKAGGVVKCAVGKKNLHCPTRQS